MPSVTYAWPRPGLAIHAPLSQLESYPVVVVLNWSSSLLCERSAKWAVEEGYYSLNCCCCGCCFLELGQRLPSDEVIFAVEAAVCDCSVIDLVEFVAGAAAAFETSSPVEL